MRPIDFFALEKKKFGQSRRIKFFDKIKKKNFIFRILRRHFRVQAEMRPAKSAEKPAQIWLCDDYATRFFWIFIKNQIIVRRVTKNPNNHP